MRGKPVVGMVVVVASVGKSVGAIPFTSLFPYVRSVLVFSFNWFNLEDFIFVYFAGNLSIYRMQILDFTQQQLFDRYIELFEGLL
jgi:hypothetical protein